MAETPALRHLGSTTACLSLAAFAVSAALLPAVLPRAAASLGVEAGTLSWVLAIQLSTCCAAAVAGRILADRHGMRPVLLSGALALACGAALWLVAGGLGTAHLAAGLMGAGGGVLEALGSVLLAAGIWPTIVALAAAPNPGHGGSAVGTLGMVAAPLAHLLMPNGAFFPAMAALFLAAGLVLLPLRSPKGPT